MEFNGSLNGVNGRNKARLSRQLTHAIGVGTMGAVGAVAPTTFSTAPTENLS